MCISKAIRWTLAAVAAVAVAAGCGATARHTQAPERVGVTALVHPIDYFSTNGNDGTCRRGLRSRPCLTLDRACKLSRSGDFIVKIGGSRWARSTGCLVHLTQPSIAGATLSSVTPLSVSCGFASGITCTAVAYLIDGVQVCTSSTGPSYSCSWDTTTATDGTHTVQASASTSSGTRVSISFNETVLNGGSGQAVLFVATTGTNNCVRSVSGVVSFATAVNNNNVCNGMNLANTKAFNGDAVLMESGSYAHQSIIGTSRTVADGTCSIVPTGIRYSEIATTTGCVTFTPDTGATVNIDGGECDGCHGVQIGPGLNFTNPGTPTTTEAIGFSVNWTNATNGSQCKGPQPHDVIVTGNRLFVSGGIPAGGTAPLAAFGTNGSYYVSYVANDIGPVYDNQATWQFGNLDPSATNCVGLTNGPGIHTLYDFGIYIGRNNYHDLIQDQASNFPSVSTCNSDLVHYKCNHIAGIHPRFSDSWIIDNKFTNVAQQDIELQTFAGSSNAPNISNTAIVGNIADKACSNQTTPCIVVSAGTLTLTANESTACLCNDVVAFNSMNGGMTLNSDEQGGGPQNLTPFAGTVWFGNFFSSYGFNDVALGGSSPICPPDGSFVLDAVNSGTQCGTDYHVTGFPWSGASGPPTYDFSLTGTPNVANMVPTSTTVGAVTAYCPATDQSGAVRPKLGNANCANGALEP